MLQFSYLFPTYLLTDVKYVLDEFYALPPDIFGITDRIWKKVKRKYIFRSTTISVFPWKKYSKTYFDI